MRYLLRKVAWLVAVAGLLGLGAQVVRWQSINEFVSGASDRRWPADPRLKWLDEDAPCNPERHVAFLKTHKCASSAIQNIMFRYGEKYDLLFALPSHNYFGGGTRYVNKAMIDAELTNRLGFDIYAVHSKWNLTQMKEMMPNDTKFITIVREPSELFLSMFDYTGMQDWAKMDLKTYIGTVKPNSPRKWGFIGYNQMAWDFGLPAKHFEDMKSVDQLVAQADELFDLVMVAERMPESLVLLRRLLCGQYEDVVVLRVNARRAAIKENDKLDQHLTELLRKRLAPDYKIYSHFYEKFERLVERYGSGSMAQDLARYDETSLTVQETCAVKKVDGSQVAGISKQHVDKVVGYMTNSTNPVCQALVTSELSYFDQLRKRQTKTVLSRLRQDGKMPVNMDAIHGGIPLPNFV